MCHSQDAGEREARSPHLPADSLHWHRGPLVEVVNAQRPGNQGDGVRPDTPCGPDAVSANVDPVWEPQADERYIERRVGTTAWGLLND
ncbi:hypothetical protein NDU88_010773 [Pleurodeles waltl]|uniref:Uncharacterized protein n=1 Tax=Pleurodeles waltl TaxID=8319 RepID=A0AAV7QZ61_PLEWA|nr:hypothetical protein NDU88_010773 [Pleurodeles waltl]